MKVNNPKQSSRNSIINEFNQRKGYWGQYMHDKLGKHNKLHKYNMVMCPYLKAHFIYEQKTIFASY